MKNSSTVVENGDTTWRRKIRQDGGWKRDQLIRFDTLQLQPNIYPYFNNFWFSLTKDLLRANFVKLNPQLSYERASAKRDTKKQQRLYYKN